jgi:hypothetical protein
VTDNLTDPEEAARRKLLRQMLATLAYRANKAVTAAPNGFGDASAGGGTRSALVVISHMADLMEWGTSVARDQSVWRDGSPSSWDGEVNRFFAGLEALDRQLASSAISKSAGDKLIQGPIADALTHLGQIGILRRIAGSPVRGESYARATITEGRVGRDQAAPNWEFD